MFGHLKSGPGEGAHGGNPGEGDRAGQVRRELIRGTIIPSDFYKFGLWNQANRPLGKSSR